MHSSAYANQSMAKSPKRMIEVALRGTTGQARTNRQGAQPIQKRVAIPVKYQKQLVNSL